MSIDGRPYGATLSNGTYDAVLTPGSHSYSVAKTGVGIQTGNVTITNGQTTPVNVCLGSNPSPTPTATATSTPAPTATATATATRDRNSYANGHCDRNSDGYGNGSSESNSYSYTNSDCDTNAGDSANCAGLHSGR